MKKNDLILQNIEFANRLALQKKKTINNKRIYFEELQSAAFIGLVEAANRFDPIKGNFLGFASRRIKGAMIDYLRELNWDHKQLIEFSYEQKTNEVLEGVPSRITKILVLRYLENRTLKEIGKELGISCPFICKEIKKWISSKNISTEKNFVD